MERSLGYRLVGLGLAGILLTAAAFSTTALFKAPLPGSDLNPVGGAEKVISLIQGQETVLWTALTGTVGSYQVLGWPTSDGTHDLGGALVLERPESGSAGVIDFVEKPMSIEFNVDG